MRTRRRHRASAAAILRSAERALQQRSLTGGQKFERSLVALTSKVFRQHTHEHRSEQWVVIQGCASATVDDEVRTVRKGESIDVPLGAKHRLANEHDEELVIVEVQLGDYTGEDDICRIEDDYGRTV